MRTAGSLRGATASAERVSLGREAIRAANNRIPAASDSDIRVAIVDARRLIAEALATLITSMAGFVVTDVVSWQEPEALNAAQNAELILVVVGASFGEATGFVRLLRTLAGRPEIVILADGPQPDLLKFVLDEHLNGLLITEVHADDFGASLNQVAGGHAVLPAGWQTMLADDRDDPLSSLSDRQMQVLELLSEGYSYDQIARRLFISVNTVKFHIRSIFSQLGVRNRVAAARLLAQKTRPSPQQDTSLAR